MLQFSELFLQSVKLLFVGRKVLLNKTQNNSHDFLLRKCRRVLGCPVLPLVPA